MPLDDVAILGVVVSTLWILVSMAWTRRFGPGQLLWLCDVATLGTAVGLLCRSPLILTAQFTGMVAYHLGWQLDFFAYAASGWMPLQATAYMFSDEISAYEKALSFFQHIFLLPICVWGLVRIGVSAYGWLLQSVQAGVVLALTWALTSPSENINWIFGAGFDGWSPAVSTPAIYYFLLIGLPPFVAYAPANRVARIVIASSLRNRRRLGAARAAIPAFVFVAAGMAATVGWACEPSAELQIRIADDPLIVEHLPTAESPQINSIRYGPPLREQIIPLFAWQSPLPLSGDRGGQPRVLLLRALLESAALESLPRAPQQIIIEGQRGRLGTVVCAIVGAVTFHRQPVCDARTAIKRFRVYAQLGNDGLTEFALPQGTARPLADNQVGATGPVQSMFVITVIAFDKNHVSRSPLYVVRRTGVWTLDDVEWSLRNGAWTATHAVP